MNLVVLYGGKHDEIAKALEGTTPLSLHILRYSSGGIRCTAIYRALSVDVTAAISLDAMGGFAIISFLLTYNS